MMNKVTFHSLPYFFKKEAFTKLETAILEKLTADHTDMKSFIAFLMLLFTVALICTPLYLVWLGLVGDLTLGVRIIIIAVGVLFTLLVRPVSIITGKDLRI
jgi:hypothetical protein